MTSNHHLALSAVNSNSIVSPTAYAQKKITEAIALSQHHEVVTGTVTHDVKQDFLDYIYKGLEQADQFYGDAINEVLESRTKF